MTVGLAHIAYSELLPILCRVLTVLDVLGEMLVLTVI